MPLFRNVRQSSRINKASVSLDHDGWQKPPHHLEDVPRSVVDSRDHRLSVALFTDPSRPAYHNQGPDGSSRSQSQSRYRSLGSHLPHSTPFASSSGENTYASGLSVSTEDNAASGSALSLAQSGLGDAPVPVLIPAPRKNSHVRRRGDNHIPRPRNAFIFFRSYYYEQQQQAAAKASASTSTSDPVSSDIASTSTKPQPEAQSQQNELSKVCGRVWKAMSEAEKAPFVKMAEDEKVWHKKEYPNYIYAPGKVGGSSGGSGGGGAGRKGSKSQSSSAGAAAGGSASASAARRKTAVAQPKYWSRASVSSTSSTSDSDVELDTGAALLSPPPPPREGRVVRAAAQRAVKKFAEVKRYADEAEMDLDVDLDVYGRDRSSSEASMTPSPVFERARRVDRSRPEVAEVVAHQVEYRPQHQHEEEYEQVQSPFVPIEDIPPLELPPVSPAHMHIENPYATLSSPNLLHYDYDPASLAQAQGQYDSMDDEDAQVQPSFVQFDVDFGEPLPINRACFSSPSPDLRHSTWPSRNSSSSPELDFESYPVNDNSYTADANANANPYTPFCSSGSSFEAFGTEAYSYPASQWALGGGLAMGAVGNEEMESMAAYLNFEACE